MIQAIQRFVTTLATKKPLRDVGYVYIGHFVNGLSLFLLSVVLGRALTKEEFGIFSLAILVLGTVAELSDFGLNAGFLRFAPLYIREGQTNKLLQLVKTVWQWRIGASVVFTILGVIAAPLIAQYIFDQPTITSYIRFSFLGIGGVILLGFVTTYAQAAQRFVPVSLLNSAKGFIRLLLIGACLLFGLENLSLILFIYLIIPWVLVGIGYRMLPKNFYGVHLEKDTKNDIHSQLAHFSFWMTVWSISAILSARVDQTMISHFLNLDEVANYSVAFQFIFIYTVALQSITSVLTPKINGLQTKEQIKAFIFAILRWIIPLVFVLAILIFPSQYIIDWLFAGKYHDALPVYLILSYAVLINFLSIPVMLSMVVFNRTHLVAFAGFLQLLINVVCNFFLIPRYGSIGAAITFAIGMGISQLYNLLCVFYLFQTKEIAPT